VERLWAYQKGLGFMDPASQPQKLLFLGMLTKLGKYIN
jgi:hypothetical protein